VLGFLVCGVERYSSRIALLQSNQNVPEM
jgi:hypothetical protein